MTPVGSGASTSAVLFAHLVIAIVVIAASTALGILHVLDAQAVVAVYGTAVGLAGGTAGSVALLGAKNGSDVSAVADRQKQIMDSIARISAATSVASGTPNPEEEK